MLTRATPGLFRVWVAGVVALARDDFGGKAGKFLAAKGGLTDEYLADLVLALGDEVLQAHAGNTAAWKRDIYREALREWHRRHRERQTAEAAA